MAAESAEPGTHEWSLEHQGRTRTYRIYVPKGYEPAKALPLVIAMHGGTGTAKGMQKLAGNFDEIADREGFFVAYPDGYGRTWNDGRALDSFPAMKENVDDVDFIRTLIDTLHARLNVDVTRVYATGISNGGHMSHRLAAELSDRLAAVAPVAASMPANILKTASPAHPIGILMIFGTEDPLNWWKGGGAAGGTSPPVPDMIRWWARQNGCAEEPTVTRLPDAVDDGTHIRREDFSPCASGYGVALLAIEGGGHTWPGGWQYLPEERIGKTTRNLNANEAMWAFFKQHRREAQ